jgi:tetratricopeptide (TPR) repeat protein
VGRAPGERLRRSREADFARAVAVEDFGDVDESARLRALWGRFLIRRGRYALAAHVLAEALRIVPEMPLVLAQQGELALRQGKYSDAIGLFDRAFAAGRELRYLMDRGRALQLKGDTKGAAATRAQVETLVRGELATTGLGHRLDLVETLVDRGAPRDLTEAIELAKTEVGNRPSAETHFQLARAYARSGSLHQAGTEIRRALALGVHDARVYELAARIESKLGNAARAKLYAHEARGLDPANKGWRMLGMP